MAPLHTLTTVNLLLHTNQRQRLLFEWKTINCEPGQAWGSHKIGRWERMLSIVVAGVRRVLGDW